ncbi:MAG TPA: CocE/NonD family hydrolase, partial [Acidimicrobiia bacterium]|nr:CocE/NonD family hydrolase [Acidimicrobiia bacterium]
MPTVVEAGLGDMADVAARDDVLVYDTAPLDDPVEIAGNVRFEGWVATSAADADVSAVLVDVHPDGTRMLVADGYVRLRHRNGFNAHDPVATGEPVEVAVDLWDVSWTFAAGHRIGLQLASASFPRFDVNLGTGEAPGVGTLDDAIVADQTVFHDADRPSALVIPVV